LIDLSRMFSRFYFYSVQTIAPQDCVATASEFYTLWARQSLGG